MRHWQIKASLFLNYFLFAILLNSVGTVILQVQNNFGVSGGTAAALEAFKDLTIAAVSFLVSSYLTRVGYKNAMLIALGFISLVCFLMPSIPSFHACEFLFAATGFSFALIKMSVYSTLGLVTADSKEHISLMNFIESFFMIGILAGYFIFSGFVDNNHPRSTEWFRVYYLLGAVSVVSFALLWSASLDESSVKAHQSDPGAEGLAALLRLLKTPVVMAFIACAFLYVLLEQSIMSWLPTFNNKVLLLPAALSIQMASILAGSTAAGRFLAGIVMKSLNWLTVLITCLLSSAALVLIAMPLARHAVGHVVTGWGTAPIAAFVFPMIGLLIAPIYPAINSIILSALPVHKHGQMSGLIIVFSALGGTTGSIITGIIFQHYGGQSAFYLSLLPITALMICLLLFQRLQVRGAAETI